MSRRRRDVKRRAVRLSVPRSLALTFGPGSSWWKATRMTRELAHDYWTEHEQMFRDREAEPGRVMSWATREFGEVDR